jgi:NAD(P)-dependent dehydrogenase (short-subunit alcohol dehydrogenase family)
MGISFAGKVAVVTGGAMGIGAATAELLSELGARVAILDRDDVHGRALMERLNGLGHAASFHACDVGKLESVQSAIDAAAKQQGALHVAVHCAGIQRYGDALSSDVDTWHETLRIHVDGCFYTVRSALPYMIDAKEGSIVIVGSVQSIAAIANSAAYVTAKHALLGFTRSVALDFASRNIRANCVLPGAVDTPMLRWSASLAPDPEAVLAGCRRAHPLGRIGQPIEIARAIAFLASDWSSFVTGAALTVDGGMLVPAGGVGFQEDGTGSVARR